MPNIIKKIEKERGCGFRKKGGLYLVSDGIGAPCDRLPIALHCCKYCGEGIKQSRGFKWIISSLFTDAPCSGQCEKCPLNLPDQRMGLLWVGEAFYTTPGHFTREANEIGVSKRISQVPRDFKVGETWIALAHPKAVQSVVAGGSIEMKPGIFRAFRPDRIEYVVKGTESPDELDKLEKRGFTLVDVIPEGTQTTFLDTTGE